MKNYFQASNHQNTEALLQIMQKNNRMEHYIDHGYAQEPLMQQLWHAWPQPQDLHTTMQYWRNMEDCMNN